LSDYCIDSGILIALYSRRDQQDRREKAREYIGQFQNRANKMVLPWPIMYEVVGTAIAMNRAGMEMFARQLRDLRQSGQLIQVDDSPYREKALEECFAETARTNGYRGISLVDRVLRMMLNDKKYRFSGLITFNERDFVDVCRLRSIRLLGRV
jgi:predicted nucleic acid-binding protein